jgi:hypothetical protein
MRMYSNLTFIHNYLHHSQLLATTLQSRTLSLPWHVTHSFRGHPNHSYERFAFIPAPEVEYNETSWPGRLPIFSFSVHSPVDLVRCLKLFPLFLHYLPDT